jgi:CcmD family protein
MNPTYAILIAILVIWVGVFLYLVALDRKLDRISREMKHHER